MRSQFRSARNFSLLKSDMTGIDQCLFSLTRASCGALTRVRSAAKIDCGSGVHLKRSTCSSV